MNGAELKATLQEGGRVYGTMITHGRNPRWVEALGGIGLDYVVIDTEHGPRSRAEMADYLAAFSNSPVVPIIRIPIPTSHYVTMALDAGSQGILAPYCETVEQVKEVIGAAKWRPLKGEAVKHLMDSGQHVSEDTRAFLENRNRNTVAIIGIESVEAVNNLEDILQVPGIDGIFVGPNDISISIGYPDQYDRPEYQEIVKKVIDTSEAHGIPTLVHHQTADLSSHWVRQGARFVLHTTDRRTLAEAYRREFAALREVANED